MRNLSLHQPQPIREKKKVVIRNNREQAILENFNISLKQIREKRDIIHFLEKHNQSVLDIRQSQIILLVSALDFYIHDIVKYCFIQKFNGLQTKTKQYHELLIPMNLVEVAIQKPESTEWLDQAITNIYQYKNFTSYEKIQNQLNTVGISKGNFKKVVAETEVEIGMPHPIETVRLLRNKLAHQEQQVIDNLELTDATIESYINFYLFMVHKIHQLIVELD